jgi:4-amino-4-deoxy-L-arabinose transferase-like glycosyltransferase
LPAGRRRALALGALLALAAVVRFAGIGSQSFWLDEVVTAELVNKPFGDLLSTIPHSESTPYLYYVLLWPWAHVFGDGEAGLRSLSALFGVATVAAIWAGARALISERAGLAAAALAAINPFLIWYSQEARAYALLALLSAVSFWCFARALRDPRWLKWWALASVLALATHYFAAFTIVPEAIALAVLAGRTRAWAIACAAIGAGGLALAPLAATQRRGGGADWIGDIPLTHRIAEIPKRFVAGEFGNQLGYVFWPVLICALVALVLLWTRTGDDERRGGIVALAVGAAGLLVPIAMAVATLDYVFPRNLIGSLPPLLVAFAAGLTASRAPRAGAAVLALVCALSLVAVVRIATDDALQRDDWRSAVAILDHHHARVVVVSPANEARTLRWYLPGLPTVVDPGVATDEVAIVGLTRAPRDQRPVPRPPAGFRTVLTVDRGTYRLIIADAPQELVVSPAMALGSALEAGNAAAVADLRR